MPHQTAPFQVLAGTTQSYNFAFAPTAVGVDNPTGFYVHLKDAGFGGWVKPFTTGAIVPVATRDRSLLISSTETPSGAASTVAAAGQAATCLAFEDPQPYSPGIPSLGTPQSLFFRQVGAGGSNVVAGVPGQTIQIYGILFSIDTISATGFALVSDGAVSQIVAQVTCAALGTSEYTPTIPIPLGVGVALRCSVLTGGNCGFSISYTQA